MKKNIIILFLLSIFQINLYAQKIGDFETVYLGQGFLEFEKTDNNLWEIGVPNKSFFDSAYSFPNALATDLKSNYSSGNTSVFYLIESVESPTLTTRSELPFYYKLDTREGRDGMYIEVSYDNGENWWNIINDTVQLQGSYEYTNPDTGEPITGGAGISIENGYSKSDTLMNGIPCFTGSQSSEWIEFRSSRFFPSMDSDALDSIFYRFTFKSDTGISNMNGIIIDNLFFYLELEPLSVNNQVSESEYIVYPNPIPKNKQLFFKEDLNASRLTLYNLIGNEILSESIKGKSSINLTNYLLEPGLYQYKMTNDLGQIVLANKLIVR